MNLNDKHLEFLYNFGIKINEVRMSSRTPSDQEKIALLQKLLAQANRKLEKAESKLKATETELKEKNEIIRTLRVIAKSLPIVTAILKDRVDYLKQHPELPRKDLEDLIRFVEDAQKDFTNVSSYRAVARLLKKGSEKISVVKAEKMTQDLVTNVFDPAVRGIMARHKRLGETLAVIDKVAQEAAKTKPEDEAIAAAAAIANIQVPDLTLDETKPSMGRQIVDALQKRETLELKPLTECPHCHAATSDLEFGRPINEMLRDIATGFRDLADNVPSSYRQVRCPACNTVWLDIPNNVPVPVKPHRTLSQNLVIASGLMNASGIPLHKINSMIVNVDDQLGHETLGDNVNEWGLDSGKLLVERMHEALGQQPVVVMDETPYTVLQSKGQGVCKAPETTRSKDYIAVMCSPFKAKERAVIFSYLGSRGTEAIEQAIGQMHCETIVSDGYAAYDAICRKNPKIKHQSCVAHMRRELLDALNIKEMHDALFGRDFDKAVEEAQKRFESKSPAFLICSVLQGFSKIYAFEHSPGNNRKQAGELMRQIDRIMCTLAKTCAQSDESGKRWQAKNKGSLIDSAVCYYMNRRETLRTFVDNPLVPPDSNAAEYAIRAITVLRKASDFKQSQDYVRSMCVWFSLNESAKANGIRDPHKWLVEYGRALYMHRAQVTLTHEVINNGRKLDSKLMGFNKDSEKGFDFDAWLPWNYAKRESADKT